ncbi:MAG: GNAT family N-acetyltransferase [Bauldia sp.]|uniref:GNAT family N-acetyltransferase n=1 Tax=Bauldia sp. TaxID=2575872 RepID=UPI001DD9BE9C|nr:GNAT family N-acetyltransferase [Bauldia sp.]MCB1497997.1 GNAT family N-acetyltransferase [Bauldia sp.]
MSVTVVPIGEAEEAGLLALNNANARETSMLTPEKWRAMVADAFSATCVPDGAALLIAFDETADYHSPNFLWFRDRYPRFVYVDRIVVADAHRGRGLASALYGDLFGKATEAGHEVVVCEVNAIPPNPVSDAFHARLGFTEVGRADLAAGEKTVRYLARTLG